MTKNNTGDWSTGDWSTGYWSTGDWSTGDRSTGDRSTGDGSTGYKSTGDRSTGDRSTGYKSTGDRSTGDRSTGDRSTGDWSTGDRSTGDFCTERGEKRMFNKPVSDELYNSSDYPQFLYFDIAAWIDESYMTDKQKYDDPDFHTKGGTLVTIDYKEAFIESWNNADKDDRAKIKDLPNFDADIFFEISGIDVNAENKAVTLEERIAQLEKQLQEINNG